MDDDDDDAHVASYQHEQQQQQQQLHSLYSEELHQVTAAAPELQEGVEVEEDVDEKEDEEDEDEEDEDEEDEDEEEDAIDDDEDVDEDEDDDEDEDEDEEDGGDQEQQDYEQDFELEQRRDKQVAGGVGTHNILNGSGNVRAVPLTSGLITKLVSQQQQPVGRMEGQEQQLVGVDSKPNIRDDWTEPATHALLEAWGERYVQLNKGNLKQEDWEEVAVVVTAMSRTHKTDVQCKNRLDTLKKKYKVEKHKQSTIGSSDSKWPFYKQLDNLLSATVKRAGIPGAVDAGHPVNSCALDSSRGELFNRVRKSEAEDMNAMPNDNNSASSKSKWSPEMTFSSPPHAPGMDGNHSSSRKRKFMDTPFRTLAKAITKFGEIYEKMEQSKQQQLMDLEKIRMEFTRDLELQRMQLFMQTQVELAKMKHGGNDIDTTVSHMNG